MTAPARAAADCIDRSQVAFAVAHLELLLEAAELLGRISPEDVAAARGAIGETRRISRDFDRDRLEARETADTWARRLHSALGHRQIR